MRIEGQIGKEISKASGSAWTPSWQNTVAGDGIGDAVPRPGQKRYTGFVFAAVSALLEHFSKQKSTPKWGLRPFVFTSEAGYRFPLLWLASSYPFLKRAVDITSLKGNLKGADKETFYEKFQAPDRCETSLRELKERIRDGSFQPGTLRSVHIPKASGGFRTLHIPTLTDRIVERAVAMTITPIFEPRFVDWSFGFRPGLSIAHALNVVRNVCNVSDNFVLGKLDMRDAFNRIPHQPLLEIVELWIKDRPLLDLIWKFIHRKGWRNKRGKPNVGLPQGGPLSPLLFNTYVNHFLDQRVMRKHPDIKIVRYADDILIVAKTAQELEEQRRAIINLIDGSGLDVNEKKTGASADLKKGEIIDYLGFRIGLNEGKTIRIHVGRDAFEYLIHKLAVDVAGQKPPAGYRGRKTFYQAKCEFLIGSWLEAYAGGISEDERYDCREDIRTVFIQKGSPISRLINDGMIQEPDNDVLDALYERARGHWEYRNQNPPGDIWTRLLGLQRDAAANFEDRWLAPVLNEVSDGADYWSAPSTITPPSGNRKTGPDEVDFRVQLLEPFEI